MSARSLYFLKRIWAAPTTAVGLPFVLLTPLTGGRVTIEQGVIEVAGGFAAWFLRHGTFLKGGANAMTLGHIVLARDQESLDLTRAHERVHVRQCERWGPFFLPAYGMASLIAWWRGGRAYRDNVFEREAYDNA